MVTAPIRTINLRDRILGLDEQVPLLDGRRVPYVILDNAASTPPLQDVMDELSRFMPFYSSVHRGTGLLSSIREIESVMSKKVPILSSTIKNVLNYDKAIYNFNEALFAFDSLTDLKAELASYFNSI